MKNTASPIYSPVKPHALIALLFLSTVVFSQAQSAQKSLHLTFFGSATCGECAEIKTQLLKPLEHQHAGKLAVTYRDIEVEKDLAILTAMEKGYHVKTTAPQELFFPDTVLVGYDNIMKNGRQLIERHLSHPEKWAYAHAYGDSTIDTISAASMIKDRMKTWSFVGLFAIGFVDGVNPCAIASMIFLISFLGTQNRRRSDVLKIGLAFTGITFPHLFHARAWARSASCRSWTNSSGSRSRYACSPWAWPYGWPCFPSGTRSTITGQKTRAR